LTLLVNFFVGVVGDKEIGTQNALAQIFQIAVFIVILYLLVRNFYIQKKLKERNQQLIAHEKTVDDARNTLIAEQTKVLTNNLNNIDQNSSVIKSALHYALFADGFARMNDIYQKFELLGSIRTGVKRHITQFNLRDAIEITLQKYQEAIAAKNISVENNTKNILISQNETLFVFMISSLIDNAIKFNKDHGSILIDSDLRKKTVTIRFSDSGQGIDSDKINQLFKPFSRGGSAVEFNYEGLGLSLFLDKLIMDYTGGNIAAATKHGGGTDITVMTPVNLRTIY
jgi:signal transduction histidine kinase